MQFANCARMKYALETGIEIALIRLISIFLREEGLGILSKFKWS